MNRFILDGIRRADLGTDLLYASQGSRGAQGRSTDFETVDADHGFESRPITMNRKGIGRRFVVSPCDQGIDWCGGSGRRVFVQLFVDSFVLNQAEPVQETTDRGGFRPLSRRSLHQASIWEPRFEGSTDDPETITIGHDASDIVTTRAELNERHGHDDLELGIRTGKPGHESELDGRYRVPQEGP
ncbi:MAG: hypothetical protein CMJ23_10910 [Phycisphaerae bacterium]|nr:hypothetical protein [Phycisphaerae bacterium]